MKEIRKRTFVNQVGQDFLDVTPKYNSLNKFGKLRFIAVRNLADTVNEKIRQTMIKYLQITYLIQNLYPRYKKNTQVLQ